MLKVLTVAGSDNSGGAGIQADLKVFTVLNVYGMAVITSLTAQNTTGVKDIYPVNGDFVYKQIETIVKDIGLDSAKTGMLLTEDVVEAVVAAVKQFKIKNLVVDTVFKSKNGKNLLSADAIDIYIKKLLPEALVITPNIPEAEVISGVEIKNLDDVKKAAKQIHKINKGYVVLKGGHLIQDKETVDIIYDGNEFIELRFPYIKTKNTHGTGCTYSAAIAAYLARIRDPIKAIRLAKAYIHGAIENSLNIGKGHGPLNHNWLIT